MAANYCNDDLLLSFLPPDVETIEKYDTDVERLVYINKGSAEADEMVAPRFTINSSGQKFPDHDADPSTPRSIQNLAAMLSAGLILSELAIDGAHITDGSLDMRERAQELADEINDGKRDIFDSSGTRYGVSLPDSTTRQTRPDMRNDRQDVDGNLLEPDGVPHLLDDFVDGG